MLYTYSRVSTLRQAEEGESLQAQDVRLAGYAMMLGKSVHESFVDRGISGSVPFRSRPAGMRLLASLRASDQVICCKLDRCFRSALDALDVLQHLKSLNVELHLIDMGGNVCGDGIAKLVFTILSAVAEAERDRICERITEVKRFQRTAGRYLGGTRPFGFEVQQGQLIAVASEQATVKAIRTWRMEGFSLRSISRKLANDGVSLSHAAVRGILRRDDPMAR